MTRQQALSLVELISEQRKLNSAPIPANDFEHPFIFGWSASAPRGNCDSFALSSDPLPAEIGEEWGDAWSAGQGTTLCSHRCRMKRAVSITGTRVAKHELLTIRAALISDAELRWGNHAPVRESSGQYSVHLYSEVGTNCTVNFRPDSTNACLAPVITRDHLCRLLAGQRLPKPIERFLEGRHQDFFMPPRPSPVIRRVLRQIQSHPYQGPMADLYLQGKVYEILAETLTDLADGEDDGGRVAPDDRRRVTMARDLLLAAPFDPPSLETLAKTVGLSQRRLGEAFREVYGQTVWAWLAEERLTQAGALVRDGALPIKRIAFLLGYAHVSNFTIAFTRRFGMAPASYRKATASVYAVERISP